MLFLCTIICILTIITQIIIGTVLNTRSHLKIYFFNFHFFISLMNFLVLLNFYVIYERVNDGGETLIFNVYSIGSSEQILYAWVYYTLLQFSYCACSGLALTIRYKPKRKYFGAFTPRQGDYILYIGLFLTGISTFLILYEGVRIGSVFSIAAIRTSYFRDKQILFLVSSLAMPAFIIYCSVQPLITRRVIRNALLTCLILLPVGGRGLIVFVLLPFLFHISLRRKIALLAPPLVPAVFYCAAMYRYYVREIEYASFTSFLNSRHGMLGIIYDGVEFSVAEAMTVLLHESVISRYPLESLIASAFAFVPRSLLYWKPYGSSADYTMNAYPERWDIVMSEWAISGYSELYLEYGYLLGIFIFGGVAFALTRIHLRLASISSILIFNCFISIFYFGFIRGDSYNVALLAWRVALLVMLLNLINKVQNRLDTGAIKRRIRKSTP